MSEELVFKKTKTKKRGEIGSEQPAEEDEVILAKKLSERIKDVGKKEITE